MNPDQPANPAEATFGFAAKFVLKLSGLTLLFSLLPLIFVNLPLGIFLSNFGKLYIPLLLSANIGAVLLSGALAAKLLFAWGVGGYAFSITRQRTQ